MNLVVVGVENETESTSIYISRLLDEGENVPVKLNALDIPSWFDVHKFRRGQKYFRRNFYAMFVAKLCGLVIVLSVPTILRILMLTGKSHTPAKAFRRYMDTISNMLDWYSGDLTKEGSNIYKVLLTVRGKHCAAAKKSVANGTGFISQKDMVLTQFGFMGLALIRSKNLGMHGDPEDVDGFIHFWKTIGYCMGIEDRFNLCCGDQQHVTDVCEKICNEVFKPLMEKPCEHFDHMTNALLVGLKPVVPFLTPEAFLESCKRQLNIEPQYLKGIYQRFILALIVFVYEVLLGVWWLAVVFRPVLNGLLKFSIYCNIKLPLMAYLTMGKEAWMSSEEEPVSHPKMSMVH